MHVSRPVRLSTVSLSLPQVFLAVALAVGGACSSGDGTPNGPTGGSASGGRTAAAGAPGAATGGAAGDGQETGGTGGTAAQTGGQFGAGGTAAGGHPSAGMGGGGLGGTGGVATGGIGGAGASATAGASGTGGAGETAGSSGSGGGAGAAGSYQPCPTNGNACKILPFGDSITRGGKSSDDAGYRSQLFKLIVAAKQKVTFTGSLTNGPTQVAGQTFPRMHEGHPGWTIDPGYNTMSSSYGGISSLVPSPALDGKPNVILLHIGTNDLFARDTANMSTRLEALLDKIATNAPNALIVVAQITPLASPNPAQAAYNGMIPGIVQAHAAKGQHIIAADMSRLPTADLSSDGTHPNDQGYAYMAAIWYAAIKNLLPE